MDSASFATRADLAEIREDLAHRSCRTVVSVSVNMNAAGAAGSDGVSDSAGGLAGDSVGDLAGHCSGTGIGARHGSIRFGAGPGTTAISIQQTMGPAIRTMIILRIPLHPRVIRAATWSPRRLMKVSPPRRLSMQGLICQHFCI